MIVAYLGGCLIEVCVLGQALGFGTWNCWREYMLVCVFLYCPREPLLTYQSCHLKEV